MKNHWRITIPLIGLVIINSCPVQAQFVNNVVRELKRGGKNIGKTVEKGVRDVKNTAGVAINQVGRATGQAAAVATRTVENGLQDATRTAGKAGKDIVAETGRVGHHTIDLGEAVGMYVERNVSGTVETLSDAENRLREGKILDAMFHVALDPLTKQEEAAFLATQQSGWLNTAGATAASAYGGPAGAAAYASWQTYKATGGNAELALRAGIIAGLTSNSMQGVGAMPVDATKKAVLAGSIGGFAIAASGGDADDIRDGFIKGGGMVLVQDAYLNYTNQPLDTSPATGDPYCMSPSDPSCASLKNAYFRDPDGKLQFDPSRLNRNASFVGIGSDPNNPPQFGTSIPMASDQSTLMRAVAKVPGMNAMGLFHDKWVVSWGMSAAANKATIFPAIVLTYTGTDAALTKQIAETIASQQGAIQRPQPQGGNNGLSVPASNRPGSPLPSGMNGTGLVGLPPLELAALVDEPTPPEIYSGRHATAPSGSILYVRNVANGGMVRVYIIGPVSTEDKKAGITMRLSPRAMSELSAVGNQVWVETEYEDVSLDASIITPNGDGIDDKLVFNNLRDGKWRLTIPFQFGNGITYDNRDYKNDWIPNLPAGPYTFWLENITPGQMSREYIGRFNIVR
ncbi:hypothetical protein [Hymenobacter guriensis]|uniref:Gliding motility-associated C-terminal domain-containing protein n=1 Tax=Hymenobacter guriensis TaxID=2793065 RepID=A0ABS0L4E8_9BACT|nr:hypothetical protein [Hymenobacter guriensis]MBG8555023.1 hypothetical protein [Hymenobacter guriensis]